MKYCSIDSFVTSSSSAVARCLTTTISQLGRVTTPFVFSYTNHHLCLQKSGEGATSDYNSQDEYDQKFDSNGIKQNLGDDELHKLFTDSNIYFPIDNENNK